ncbi:DMP19 family protein [Novipirellula rosea]|uniref:DMP19 family protein n=1 Tax=Novipirellula rosea TaxID=1031540 RepID=A0ABP8N8C0_9BACT
MADLFAVSETIAAKEQAVGFGSLTPAEQTFHAVWWFEAELNNGGFDQFFFNSAGDLTSNTIEALELIGASACAAIVRRACALFPRSVPSQDRDTRQGELETITDANEDAFEKLDAEFYAYPEDIAGLLTAYWDSHGG